MVRHYESQTFLFLIWKKNSRYKILKTTKRCVCGRRGCRDDSTFKNADCSWKEDLSLVPSTHMGQLTTVCNSSLSDFSGFCTCLHTHTHTHTHARGLYFVNIRISTFIQDQQWLEVSTLLPRNPNRKLTLASILAPRLLRHTKKDRTVHVLVTEFKGRVR